MPVRRLVHQSRWVEDVRVFLRGSKYIDKLAGVLYDMLPGSGNARLSRWDEADEERGQRWQKAEPFAPGSSHACHWWRVLQDVRGREVGSPGSLAEVEE